MTGPQESRTDGSGASGHAPETLSVEVLMSGWILLTISEVAHVGLFFAAGAALLVGMLGLR